jgi:HEAT repeat protein
MKPACHRIRFPLPIFLAALAIGGAAMGGVSVPADPEFNGKRLSVWLEQAQFGIERAHVIPPSVSQEAFEARSAMKKMGTNLVPVLLDCMRAPQMNDPRTEIQRGRAASALCLLGSEAKQAIPELIEMLDHPEGGQVVAAGVLSKLGADAEQALPKLIDLLKEPSANRTHFVYAVSAFGPEAEEAIPAFIELFKESRSLCNAAAHALPQIGVAAVEPLASALTNKDERFHLGAAMSLEAMAIGGLIPSNAVPALIAALKERNGRVRWLAATTLARIGSPDAELAMLASLRDPDVRVQSVIIDALPGFKQDQSELSFRLTIALTNGDQQLHYAAAVGLGRLCESGTNSHIVRAAVAALTKALKDKDEQVRLMAVDSLVRTRSPEAVPALLNCLADPNDAVRSRILLYIGSFNYDRDAILRTLDKLESDPSERIRHEARIVLLRLKAR